MLQAFLESHEKHNALDNIGHIISSSLEDDVAPIDLIDKVKIAADEFAMKDDFFKFLEEKIEADQTWKFWHEFVFHSCFSYITLYLAIKGSNWDLRNASLKVMAPVFSAFDRDVYQRIIPTHLADLMIIPTQIYESLKSGGFTVHLTGEEWKSVALDECHEMCINKDLKAAITYPTESYLQKTYSFFNYRIKLSSSFLSQIFPLGQKTNETKTIISKDAGIIKKEEIIVAMVATIAEHHLLPANVTSDRGLVNVFNRQQATTEQAHDMLNFRKIGNESTEVYIKHHIIGVSSASNTTTIRRKKLLTMSSNFKKGKRGTAKERESDRVIKCLQRRLAWCNHTGNSFNSEEEQYSIYPRALASESGIPHKGSKAKWTDKLQTRYCNSIPSVFCNALRSEWVPQVVVIDAMFIINTKPLRNTKKVSDYAKLLYTRFVKEHFTFGVVEVHIIFDRQNTEYFNPKIFEQSRRDLKATDDHIHQNFDCSSNVPIGWRETLDCRTCKYSLIKAIGLSFFQFGRFWVEPEKKLVIGGYFEDNITYIIESGSTTMPEPEPGYKSNACEADQRIWKHAVICEAETVLIYSPDTDVHVYTIGLGLISMHCKQFIIQLNLPHTLQKRYVNLNNLVTALKNDTDLASLTNEDIPQVMTLLFLASGSDFTSYFKNLGKGIFFDTFFQYAPFISGTQMTGSLIETEDQNKENGFLSFLRLVGAVYFKKHLVSFVSKFGLQSPHQLYNSIDPSSSITERHKLWMQKIRANVSERILSEEKRMPSTSSLRRHWLRVAYIHTLWNKSTDSNVYSSLPLPENYGWIRKDNNVYEIDWEDPSKTSRIQTNIDFLLSGCKCKTGCNSRKCGCKKAGKACGPGCVCSRCRNVETNTHSSTFAMEHGTMQEESSGSNTDSEEDIETVETEIITDFMPFGFIDDI